MNYIDTPVYPYSREHAKRDRQLHVWTESHKANIACAKAIDKAIGEQKAGGGLRVGCAGDVIARFGHERVRLVTAVAVKTTDDKAISQESRDWARGVDTRHITKNLAAQYQLKASPGLLEPFTAQARAAYMELGLYGYEHCSAGYASDVDYEGQVLVLDHKLLSKEEQRPESQLVLADGGSGCRPGSLGKIYGTFLSDGGRETFRRANFLGVLSQEHMPQWVAEKLNMDSPGQEPEPTLKL